MDKRTRETFYFSWIVAVIVCAVIALAVALFVSFTHGAPQAEAPETDTPVVHTVTDIIPSTPAAETEQPAETEPPDEEGDSEYGGEDDALPDENEPEETPQG